MKVEPKLQYLSPSFCHKPMNISPDQKMVIHNIVILDLSQLPRRSKTLQTTLVEM